jgi:hypothetical protein
MRTRARAADAKRVTRRYSSPQKWRWRHHDCRLCRRSDPRSYPVSDHEHVSYSKIAKLSALNMLSYHYYPDPNYQCPPAELSAGLPPVYEDL